MMRHHVGSTGGSTDWLALSVIVIVFVGVVIGLLIWRMRRARSARINEGR